MAFAKYKQTPIKVHPRIERIIKTAVAMKDIPTFWVWSHLVLREDLFDFVMELEDMIQEGISIVDQMEHIEEYWNKVITTEFYIALPISKKVTLQEVFKFTTSSWHIAEQERRDLFVAQTDRGIAAITSATEGIIKIEIADFVSRNQFDKFLDRHWDSFKNDIGENSLGSTAPTCLRNLTIYNKYKEHQTNNEDAETKTIVWAEKEYGISDRTIKQAYGDLELVRESVNRPGQN